MAITYYHTEIGSPNSQPNNKKYNEKDVKEACWLNLYPITNYGNYRSQSLVWPF
jgi:hypothetical protein